MQYGPGSSEALANQPFGYQRSLEQARHFELQSLELRFSQPPGQYIIEDGVARLHFPGLTLEEFSTGLEEFSTGAADLVRAAAAGAIGVVGESIQGLANLGAALEQNVAAPSRALMALPLAIYYDDPRIVAYILENNFLDYWHAIGRAGLFISDVSDLVDVPEERQTIGTDIAGIVGGIGLGAIAGWRVAMLLASGTGVYRQREQLSAAGVDTQSREALIAMLFGAAIGVTGEFLGLRYCSRRPNSAERDDLGHHTGRP